MAKGIEINGQMRGKRGGVVYYRAAGQQISRARNFEPANPKTAKQAVQRMVLATASKITAALRPIINHSWEGVRSGDVSVRHFQSRTMRYLRDVAAVYLDGSGESAVSAFAIKGAPIAGSVAGLTLSSGQLTFPGYTQNDGQLLVSAGLPEQFDGADEYVEFLASLGMLPGDQLTVVGYFQNLNVHAADFGNEWNPVDAYRYARIVFRPVADIDFTNPVSVLESEGTSFNPAIIERAEGVMPPVSAAGASFQLAFDMSAVLPSFVPCGSAIIISRKLETGKFLYNTARLASDVQYWDANNAYPVYESYMATSTPIEVGDVYYLQHAVAAPFYSGGGVVPVSPFPFSLSVMMGGEVLGVPMDSEIYSMASSATELVCEDGSPEQLASIDVIVNSTRVSPSSTGVWVLAPAGASSRYDVQVRYNDASWVFVLWGEAEP